MRSRGSSALVAMIAVVPLLALVSVPATAQLLSDRPKDSVPPRARAAGKTPMTALPDHVVEPRRTADGWPDLQGIWSSQAYYAAGAQHSLEVGRDPGALLIGGRDPKASSFKGVLIDPMRGMIPYQPWAQAKRQEMLAGIYAPARRLDVDPTTLCFQVGVVGMAIPESPWELRYLPGRIVIPVNNRWHTPRIIYMDGTPHPGEEVHLFNGDSRGHWDGNALVVETANNREGNWLDAHGTFHSENMRVIERYTMVTQDQLYYEATVIDPTVFTQPWKWATNYDRVKRNPSNETQEDGCHEGERTIDKMVIGGLRARQAGIRGYYIHQDLETGKAVRPEEQKYLDESDQPAGYVFAPMVTDEEIATKKWAPRKK